MFKASPQVTKIHTQIKNYCQAFAQSPQDAGRQTVGPDVWTSRVLGRLGCGWAASAWKAPKDTRASALERNLLGSDQQHC